MKIRFKCSCGRNLAASSEHAGKKARCPRCGAQVTIPAPPGEGPPIRINREELEGEDKNNGWHYAIDGKYYGPLSAAQLEEMAQTGEIAADTLVWKEGMSSWKALMDTELGALVASSEKEAVPNKRRKTTLSPLAETMRLPGRASTPTVMKANRRVAGKICAICQDKIRFGEEICICDYCELPFHVSCWQENGGCGTYGCQASPDAPGRQREPDFSVPEEQVSESRLADRGQAIEGEGSASATAGSPTIASRTSGLAIASFVLGLLGLCGIGSLLAIIFGYCALSEIDKSPGQITGRGLAIAGVVLGYVFGVIALLYFLSVFAGSP